MKSSLFLLFTFILCGGCDKFSLDPFTPCMQQKIDGFKLDPGAESIILIEKPDDPLFWFVDIVADGLEEVVNTDCTLVCVTDCYCITDLGCDPSIFNFPQKIIWER